MDKSSNLLTFRNKLSILNDDLYRLAHVMTVAAESDANIWTLDLGFRLFDLYDMPKSLKSFPF